jgi:hypothetical protein
MAPTRDVLPESVVRCLLALGGDLGEDATGKLRIRRVALREIVSLVPVRSLDLLRISRRQRPVADQELAEHGLASIDRHVQPVADYRFCRLDEQIDYQPIILALKGIQLHYRPNDMLVSKQLQADLRLEAMFDSLIEWSESPRPISSAELTEFIDAVLAGLRQERLGRSPHSEAYINQAVEKLQLAIGRFNQKVGSQP